MIETPSWLSATLANPSITDICLNGGVGYFDSGDGMQPITGQSGELNGPKRT